MAKDKEKDIKTNAMRILDTLGVPYEVITYTCDEFTDGVHLAEQLGQPAEQTFKTLVAEGKSGGYFAFVIPVAEELDLKAAARAVGEKAVELIHVKELLPLTGYIRGGCTPIGMKRRSPPSSTRAYCNTMRSSSAAGASGRRSSSPRRISSG